MTKTLSGPQTNYTNSGTTNAIVVSGASFSSNLVNSGTISGGSATGILVESGSTIDGTISNAGKITAPGTGIFVGSVVEGGIVNRIGASIDATFYGIRVQNVSTFTGGISNNGVVSARSGINVEQFQTLTGGVTNAGTISAGKSAIRVQNGALFSGGILNNSGGLISAAFATSGNAINVNLISTFAGGITNAGTIVNETYDAISISEVSTFTGGVSNIGTISGIGSAVGIYVSSVGQFGSSLGGGITNAGLIHAYSDIDFGTVSTFFGGIVNTGTILGTRGGIFISQVGQFGTAASGEITNTGVISVASGPGITVESGSVDVFDLGEIVAGSGALAIGLFNGTDTLTLGSGYNIVGSVEGSGADILQLGGSGSGSFNLNSVGTQYTGFNTFNVVGGNWTVSGAGYEWNIGSGATLQLASGGILSAPVVSSGGTLDVLAGGTAVNVTLDRGGSLIVAPGGVVDGEVETIALGSGLFHSTASSGVTLELLSGATGSRTTIDAGGTELVTFGGTELVPTVANGGTLIVASGGTVELSGGIVPTLFAALPGATVEFISGSFPAPPAVVLTDLTVELLAGATGSGGTSLGGTILVGSHALLEGGTGLGGNVLTVSSGGTLSGGTSINGAVTIVLSGGKAVGGSAGPQGLGIFSAGAIVSGYQVGVTAQLLSHRGRLRRERQFRLAGPNLFSLAVVRSTPTSLLAALSS